VEFAKSYLPIAEKHLRLLQRLSGGSSRSM
jgi:hypothetical protein